MIKMIVSDLDETLLRSDKTISVYTEAVLLKAREAGIKLVLATARPIRASVDYQKQIQCDALICHNGNVIISEGRNIGRCHGIPIDEAREILGYLKAKFPCKKLSIEISDRIYSNYDVAVFWGKTEKERQMLKNSAVLSDFSDLPEASADKIIIELDSEEEYREIGAYIPHDLYAQLSNGGLLCVVMNRNATKFNAVRQLAELWDIPVSGITAFGDDYNDVEMIRECGIGVAMENAIAEVLEAADVVTGSNNDDGVASYIMNRILCAKNEALCPLRK